VSGRSAPPPLWVLDTNVVLSALVRPGGAAGKLRLAWQAGVFVPLVEAGTVTELIRVLAYPKFRLDAVEQADLLADYLPWARTATIPDPPPATPRCRDPHDQRFLALACACNADALVSGDADLLSMAKDSQVPLLTLAKAIAALSGPATP